MIVSAMLVAHEAFTCDFFGVVVTRCARANAASRSAASATDDAPAAGANARTTSRVPAGNDEILLATRWRNWRRTRFRTTAPPTALLTTNPARTGAAAGAKLLAEPHPAPGAAAGAVVAAGSSS